MRGDNRKCGDMRGRNYPEEGLLYKPPFYGVKGAPLSTGKATPPTPPLTGGQEKAKPPLPGGGASPFYTPLTRGGRGGCLYPLRDFFIGHSPRDARPLKKGVRKNQSARISRQPKYILPNKSSKNRKTSLENAGSPGQRRSGRFVPRNGIIPPSHRTRSSLWNARRTRRFRPGAGNRARR